MQQEQEPAKSIQRKERRWGRKEGAKTTEGAAYIAAPARPHSQITSDRFRAGGLRPADEAGRRPGNLRLPGWLRPTRALDKVLLVIEVAGALVVAWVVWQYLYTTYFDTGPRRLTPGIVGVTPTRAAPTPTSTRFVEVLPPEVVGPEEGPFTGEPGVPTPIGGQTGPTATPTVDTQLLLPTRLRIPVMFLDSPVHEVRLNMGEWEVSPMDIGYHEGTGLPGLEGNVVLAGHRDINSALFRELDRLNIGDEIFVSNVVGEHKYTVADVLEVSPDHVWVMDPTKDKRVTLITCTPPGIATRRLIVVALLDETAAGGQ